MEPAEAMRFLADRGHAVPRFEEVERLTGAAFPIPALISDEMSGEEGLALWSASRRHVTETGLAPVLIGAEPMIDWFSKRRRTLIVQRLQSRKLAAAADPATVLAGLQTRIEERFSPQVVARLREEMEAIRAAWLVRGAGDPEIFGEPVPHRLLTDTEPVRCVLLGCADHEVPLYLGLGGFNGSPEPHEQALLLRGWSARFGTAIVHVGRASVAMHSERPPARVDELRPLLWEVFLYCFDAVFQDADGDFAHLRQMLSNPWWSFWWD